jgi:hypothetical protein
MMRGKRFRRVESAVCGMEGKGIGKLKGKIDG